MFKNKLVLLNTFFFLLCFLAKIAICQQTKELSSNEIKEGWKLLFDGKTTKGWHTYNKNSVTDNWKVMDGTLVMNPKPWIRFKKEDIITNEEYENYELYIEWRISEAGNSGIIFNVKEDHKFRKTWFTGPEMQILDNIKASDNKKEDHLAGLLYDLYGTALMSRPKPIGQWNEVRIIQNKNHLIFYFNDVKTLDVVQGSTQWKNMLAKSKFRKCKNFDTTPKGKIALQDHGHEVAFRNMKIKSL